MSTCSAICDPPCAASRAVAQSVSPIEEGLIHKRGDLPKTLAAMVMTSGSGQGKARWTDAARRIARDMSLPSTSTSLSVASNVGQS